MEPHEDVATDGHADNTHSWHTAISRSGRYAITADRAATAMSAAGAYSSWRPYRKTSFLLLSPGMGAQHTRVTAASRLLRIDVASRVVADLVPATAAIAEL